MSEVRLVVSDPKNPGKGLDINIWFGGDDEHTRAMLKACRDGARAAGYTADVVVVEESRTPI